MLILSRKAEQRIVIDDNIELVVVAVSGGRVRLGIDAPSNVPIQREEIHQRVQSENHGADHEGETATAAALAEAEMVLADLRKAKDS